MSVYTVCEAKSEIDQLIKEADIFRIPIIITGQHSNAVLISEHDWDAIQETVFAISSGNADFR